MQLWEQLKKRNVIKVAGAYLALSWLIIQITSLAVPALNLPESLNSIVFYIGLIGFPLALFFAWAYELTPDGVKKSKALPTASKLSEQTGRKLERIIIVLALAGVLVLGWDKLYNQGQTPSAVLEAETGTSIAVLPLLNMSSVAENLFFANGVHEEILTNLSFIDGLAVTSRTSAEKFLGSKKTMSEIGAELGVKYIVEGSVRRVANHVRVTVQLIEVSGDHHLWASNFDRELTDVFAVQSAVSKEISNAIQVKILPDSVTELEGMPTRSVKAYDLYQKARSIDRTEREAIDTLERMRALLEEAVQMDPDFVEAWGLLNETVDHIIRNIDGNGWYSDAPNIADIRAELAVLAKRSLDKAVALDPDNLETLLALSSDSVRERLEPGFHAKRKVYIDKTLELYPEDALAWYVLGWWHVLAGDYFDADPAFRKANELDPLHARILLGSLFYFQNDPEMHSALLARFETSIRGRSMGDDFSALIQRLQITQDETLIDEFRAKYASQLAILGGNPHYRSELISVMGQDPARVLPREIPPHPGNNAGPEALGTYMRTVEQLLAWHKRTGDTESAKRVAESYLNGWDGDAQPDDYETVLLIDVYAALGQMDQVSNLADALHTAVNEEDEPWTFRDIIAIYETEPERAVDIFLKRAEDYPDWQGPDWLAIYWWFWEEFISQPKIIDYYKNDERWIAYLSSRAEAYKGLKTE